jgi:carbon-monoxide dehydrogenase small subunit
MQQSRIVFGTSDRAHLPSLRDGKGESGSAAAHHTDASREVASMTTEVTIFVNGAEQTRAVEPRTLLVEFLREGLGLTGTHVGCDTSQCGACTVLLDGKAVKSCTVLAVQAAGQHVTTVEGIGSVEALHPVQAAFWEKHGLQCGFCTPGVMMTAIGLLQERPQPSEGEIRSALDGVICRCTGYQSIVRAVQDAAVRMAARDAQTASD